jgi:eukaryotic-like serine/threonine-protein kinase
LRLRPRGLAFKPRDTTRIAPYELARIDVLSTAATDLGMVDPVKGADFGTRQLARALELGEPSRVARALVAEAMFLAARGERTWNRVEAILVRAEELAAELADPELPAWIAAARGMRAYQVGHFKRACEYNKIAVRQLREECTGVLWQVGGVEVQVMWSLFYLGELRELIERVDAGLEQARLRGNRFDGANLGTGVPSLAWAVADRTAQGRTVVANAMAQWSPRGFHLQHYYALASLASFDLYDGDPHTAHARVDATWPALERSRLMVCRSVEIGAQHLRGRVALAAGHDATPALAALERLDENPWATAMAHLLRAGMHDDPRAFTTAIDALLAIDVVAFASAARRRRGELLDDRKLVARADRELAERGVRCPERFARMLVPLRRDHDGAPTT